MSIRPPIVLLILALTACGDDPPKADTGPADTGVGDTGAADTGAEDTGVEDSGVDAGDGIQDLGTPDFGPPDAGPTPSSFCESLGLQTRYRLEAEEGFEPGTVAGGFVTSELDGASYDMEAAWEGCESFIFVGYRHEARRNPLTFTRYERLWDSDKAVLVDTPVNHHWFFMSWEDEADDRLARVTAMKTAIEAELTSRGLSAEQLGLQQRRFHYVTTLPGAIQGSIGEYFVDHAAWRLTPASRAPYDNGSIPAPQAEAVAIDRQQQWDPVGNLSTHVVNSQVEVQPYELRMVSYLPGFFDHKAGLEEKIWAERDVYEVELIDQEVTERIFTPEIELPNAATLAQFDTLEVDVSVYCKNRNLYACSEWDRIAYIHVCSNDDCSERQELVRWITPYWRSGRRRWIMDASALFDLVDDGGATRFRIEMGPEWERKSPRHTRMTLRFSNRGKTERARTAEAAFSGGNFDASYNDREPLSFTPPASTKKVELVYILSGHGQEGQVGCAEWCDHRHRFTVNDAPVPEVLHEGTFFSPGGCAVRSDEGVPPGQGGNWAQERAYWCPGLPVDHVRLDITSMVTMGQPNQLDYTAGLGGGGPAGGNISLSTYLVYSE